jgi:hypothetical protein
VRRCAGHGAAADMRGGVVLLPALPAVLLPAYRLPLLRRARVACLRAAYARTHTGGTSGLGSRVEGSGFRVPGPWFRVCSHACGLRMRVLMQAGAGARRRCAWGLNFLGSGSRVQGPGSRVQGPGSRVQGPWSRVQGPGFRVQGPGSRV